jgi:hypothetical protein
LAVWVTGRGAELEVGCWSLCASNGPSEQDTASAAPSLYNGPMAQGGATGVGEVYRSLAMGH